MHALKPLARPVGRLGVSQHVGTTNQHLVVKLTTDTPQPKMEALIDEH